MSHNPILQALASRDTNRWRGGKERRGEERGGEERRRAERRGEVWRREERRGDGRGGEGRRGEPMSPVSLLSLIAVIVPSACLRFAFAAVTGGLRRTLQVDSAYHCG